MSRIKFIKHLFHSNDLFIPFSEIKDDAIKFYLAEFEYFIYKTISHELNQSPINYTITIGLGDYPNYCWDPLLKEFIVIVSNKTVTKEPHFWQLYQSMIYYYYPYYYKNSILQYPFIADLFTASICLKLIIMNEMISYYDQCCAEFIYIPNTYDTVDIYNKHKRKASRLGRWNYSNPSMKYLADKSCRIGALLQQRLPLKAILMIGKSDTVENWLNYLEIDERIFVRLLLNEEHVKY